MDEKLRKEKTITGVKWSMLSQILVQGSNLLISILLTRLLTPDDFGLIAMIAVFTGFLAVYQDFGLGSALIYKKEVKSIDYNTVFFSHLFLGIFLALVLLLLSGFISYFYDEEILKPLVRVIAFSFIIQSFSYIQYTILKKRLDFKSIFIVDVISVISSGILAVVLAYKGYGVWSIVIKMLTLEILKAFILWLLSSWKPNFEFSKSSLKEALNYSLPLMGNKTLGYFMRNTDNLLIGKFLGAVSLGYYSRAYSLMMIPINQISGVLSSVLFPSFSLINNNLNLFKNNWLNVNRYLAFILFPLSALMIIAAKPFVIVVLGEKWSEIIPIIQIFAISGVIQGLFSNLGFVFRSLNFNKLSFKVNLLINISLIVSVIIGMFFNIFYVALLYTLITIIIVLPITFYYAKKMMNLSYKEILKTLIIYFTFSVLAGILSHFFFYKFSTSLEYELILKPLMFITVYILLLLKFDNQNVINTFLSKLKK